MIFFAFILIQFVATNKQVYFRNQSEKCVKWIRNHVFDNTQLHLEAQENEGIYIEFESFSQLQNTSCMNLKLNAITGLTNLLLLNAKHKILIENNLDLNEILNMINFPLSNTYNQIQIKNIQGFNQFVNKSKKAKIIFTWLGSDLR